MWGGGDCLGSRCRSSTTRVTREEPGTPGKLGRGLSPARQALEGQVTQHTACPTLQPWSSSSPPRLRRPGPPSRSAMSSGGSCCDHSAVPSSLHAAEGGQRGGRQRAGAPGPQGAACPHSCTPSPDALQACSAEAGSEQLLGTSAPSGRACGLLGSSTPSRGASRGAWRHPSSVVLLPPTRHRPPHDACVPTFLSPCLLVLGGLACQREFFNSEMMSFTDPWGLTLPG